MQTFRLVTFPTLSFDRRTDQAIEPGQSVGACLRALGWKTDHLTARVYIDGQLIPDAEWLTAEPAAGQAVIVRRIPKGGNGNTGKQVLQIVGMLAIFAAAFYAPFALVGLSTMLGASGGVWGGIIAASGYITAATTVMGSLALNARIPTPLPRRALPHPMRELREAA